VDDGIGGADPAKGSGLQGLADRVAALDGALDVRSGPDGGTALRVEIPCAPVAAKSRRDRVVGADV
jgi:signal transduction histidine kinase